MVHRPREYNKVALASGLARRTPAAGVGTPSARLDGDSHRRGFGRHQGRGQSVVEAGT
jgi:hypothetical protein